MEGLSILKRVSKLSKFQTSQNIFLQKNKDIDEDGEPYEEFDKSNTTFGSTMNLTPHFCHEREQWAFKGNFEDLLRIAKKLNLREGGKNGSGKLVLPDENSIYNRYDPFFNNVDLWKSVILNGDTTKVFNPENAWEEFYHRVYSGMLEVDQPDSVDSESNPLFTENSGLSLLSVHGKKVKDSVAVDEDLRAWNNFSTVVANFDKLKRIVAIIDPPTYNESYNDPAAMKVLVKNEILDVTDKSAKYGNRSPRDFFNELCEMDNGKLDSLTTIYRAMRVGIIRHKSTGATINGEPIGDGKITSDDGLVKYYTDDFNAKEFLKLEKMVQEKEKANGN